MRRTFSIAYLFYYRMRKLSTENFCFSKKIALYNEKIYWYNIICRWNTSGKRGRSSVWESVRFASLWTHIDQRKLARYSGEKSLQDSRKLKTPKIRFLLRKTAKKWQYGPIAQLGERTVRIRKVVGSIPIRSTILRKITAKSAVIFRLTTIIPQTGRISDHFTGTRAVSF